MAIENPNYNARYTSLFTGLVAGYDFKGDAKDWSGNGNDGTVTGADLTTNEFNISNNAYDFISTNSDKIAFGNIGNIKTIALRIKLDTTTENIFEESSGNGVSVSGGTLSYTTWDNVIINGVDTDIIGTDWATLVITSTTDIAATALQLGLITATYGDFICSNMYCWSRELSVEEAAQLHQIISKKDIYSYMRQGANE